MLSVTVVAFGVPTGERVRMHGTFPSVGGSLTLSWLMVWVDSSRFVIEFPVHQGTFTGTGDLFAATLLAWSSKSPHNLVEACEKVIATLQAVCKRTYSSESEDNELKIVQCKKDIETPAVAITAETAFYADE